MLFRSGGTNDQAGVAIAVDSSSNAFVTGSTMSDNFPTKSAFQSRYGGAFTNIIGAPFDVFVAKFNTAGSGSSSLLYSTYLGGNDDDVGTGIAVDAAGNAYITGYSYATNYPVTSSAVSTSGFDYVDAIVSKLSPTGSNLLYSTFLGGIGNDFANAIALDSNGLVYVTGDTDSLDFPTTSNAFMQSHSPGFDNVFVLKLNPSIAGSNAVLYATYLGGNNDSGGDVGHSIAVGTNGLIYVTGTTGSTDFPRSIAPIPICIWRRVLRRVCCSIQPQRCRRRIAILLELLRRPE